MRTTTAQKSARPWASVTSMSVMCCFARRSRAVYAGRSRGPTRTRGGRSRAQVARPHSGEVLTAWASACSANGRWIPESPLRLYAKAPRVPGVYAFVVNDVVVYVGLTKSGLHKRFEQYRWRHKRQRQQIARPDTALRCSLCDGVEMALRGWEGSGPASPRRAGSFSR
jgi:hypothetical protein